MEFLASFLILFFEALGFVAMHNMRVRGKLKPQAAPLFAVQGRAHRRSGRCTLMKLKFY